MTEGETILRDLLSNWERLLHTQPALDPLIRMAVGHYQFEAIHLYLNRCIISSKSEYYRLLLAVTRDQAWEPWLPYMIEAVEETARWTSAKIAAIRSLAEHTRNYVRSARPKIYSQELIDVIFAQPYCRISNLGETGIAKRQTASRYLKELVSLGVLQERKIGREKLFVHPRLMTLLTADGNEVTPYR